MRFASYLYILTVKDHCCIHFFQNKKGSDEKEKDLMILHMWEKLF